MLDPAQRPAQHVPGLTKLGAATIGFGLVFDLAEHSFAAPGAAAGFTLGEHAAHLVVLVGMVMGLVGVVADGVRQSSRTDRPKRSDRDALR